MSDDLYHPGREADDEARQYGADDGFDADQEDGDEEFAERVNEAIGGGEHGDPAANLAVAELLAKLAERTNELQSAQAELGERTADLQRLQAEYVNYRRRVERDRIAVAEMALGKVLTGLLPVLDDIGRARDHGELEGGFRRVAESLESQMAKLGLEQFGTAGELFDPNVHEALMHTVSPDVAEDTCVEILQPGYRLGDRILRVARVTVAQPGEPDK
ncbi:MAG TPA: nucleotide exchange factor GrpE [Actinocrinis sp.]|uniref:nucleotide exchange factor GrpE n=1 Tax=Actinocrinis sp. TaxID=1920516 RepID=UPI002DDCD423|nr:nucleotide exchange factor GrpE [Actinocrinis sp.]HEV2346549.1 nucleotide exchange factor GrpE [Actinocrinis sp.]